MKLGLTLVTVGLVILHVGLFLAFGWPAVVIAAGATLTLGGLLIDLETE